MIVVIFPLLVSDLLNFFLLFFLFASFFSFGLWFPLRCAVVLRRRQENEIAPKMIPDEWNEIDNKLVERRSQVTFLAGRYFNELLRGRNRHQVTFLAGNYNDLVRRA